MMAHFSERTLTKLRAQFAAIDADDSGEIMLDEMEAAFKKIMPEERALESASKLMKELDADNNGAISEDEFLEAHLHSAIHMFQKRLTGDRDTWTLPECRKFLENELGHSEKGREHVEDLMGKLDANGDGDISLDEFLDLYDHILPDPSDVHLQSDQLLAFVLHPGVVNSLLHQKPKPGTIYTPVIAAFFESFNRSYFNALINRRLNGVMGAYFPNMHIQIPSRSAYILGVKDLRRFFSENVDPMADNMKHPDLLLGATAIAPAVIMLPVCSLSDAINAAHTNPEPLTRRWTRGLLPRGVRETLFVLGLNNGADLLENYYREVAHVKYKVMQNVLGSFTAGLFAAYVSHVPHLLSAYKLMDPNKTYRQHFSEYLERNMQGTKVSPRFRPAVKLAKGLLLPRGVGIRTTQMCCSFAILNGVIMAVDKLYYKPS